MSHSVTRKPLVYIAHPVSGDVNRNIITAAKWVRWAAKLEIVIPVAPYVTCCVALDDKEPDERLVGMAISSRVLSFCDELWLCGLRISDGMSQEAEAAERKGIPVVDLTGYITPTEMIGGPAWE